MPRFISYQMCVTVGVCIQGFVDSSDSECDTKHSPPISPPISSSLSPSLSSHLLPPSLSLLPSSPPLSLSLLPQSRPKLRVVEPIDYEAELSSRRKELGREKYLGLMLFPQHDVEVSTFTEHCFSTCSMQWSIFYVPMPHEHPYIGFLQTYSLLHNGWDNGCSIIYTQQGVHIYTILGIVDVFCSGRKRSLRCFLLQALLSL